MAERVVRMTTAAIATPSVMAGKSRKRRLAERIAEKSDVTAGVRHPPEVAREQSTKSVPSQKFGSESPISPTLRAARSSGEFGRSADTRPSGRPISSATSVAASGELERHRQAARRSPPTTGWPVRIE